MTVEELIQELHKCPPGSDVKYVWDGAARSDVRNVWLSRSGSVVLADDGEPVYDAEEMPITDPDGDLWTSGGTDGQAWVLYYGATIQVPDYAVQAICAEAEKFKRRVDADLRHRVFGVVNGEDTDPLTFPSIV